MPADIMVGPPAPADTTEEAATERRKPPAPLKGFDQPRWVMVRSLVLPGWGQFHNGAWFKAGAIAGVEWTLIARLVDDRQDLDRLQQDIDASIASGDDALQAQLVAEYNARSDKFVARQWWLGALLAYSLLDAYIDAHFRQFRLEFEEDPALPPDEGRSQKVRLSIQRRF